MHTSIQTSNKQLNYNGCIDRITVADDTSVNNTLAERPLPSLHAIQGELLSRSRRNKHGESKQTHGFTHSVTLPP